MSETATVEPASESSGLLDNVTVEDQNAPTNPAAAEIDHRSEPAAAAPAEPADRPEWLPENFWKDGQPDLEGMAKSWHDLRTMIAQGKHKAPAEGKYDTGALSSPDDPVAKAYVGWAQKYGVSQAAFDDLAKEAGVDDIKETLDAEMRMIEGDDGKLYESYHVPEPKSASKGQEGVK